jgi:hypothetical protein
MEQPPGATQDAGGVPLSDYFPRKEPRRISCWSCGSQVPFKEHVLELSPRSGDARLRCRAYSIRTIQSPPGPGSSRSSPWAHAQLAIAIVTRAPPGSRLRCLRSAPVSGYPLDPRSGLVAVPPVLLGTTPLPRQPRAASPRRGRSGESLPAGCPRGTR